MFNPTELLKPMYENQCPACVFIGGHIDEGKRVDFYYHQGGAWLKAGGAPYKEVLFIRRAHLTEDCCEVKEANDGLFEIARGRAQELGLLNEESQHG